MEGSWLQSWLYHIKPFWLPASYSLFLICKMGSQWWFCRAIEKARANISSCSEQVTFTSSSLMELFISTSIRLGDRRIQLNISQPWKALMYQSPELLTSPQARASAHWEQLLCRANVCQQVHSTDVPGLLQRPRPAPVRKPFRGGFEVNPEETASFTQAF